MEGSKLAVINFGSFVLVIMKTSGNKQEVRIVIYEIDFQGSSALTICEIRPVVTPYISASSLCLYLPDL